MASTTVQQKPLALVEADPGLAPYESQLQNRMQRLDAVLQEIRTGADSLQQMAQGYLYFGLNRGELDEKPGVWYREWAPGADQLFFIGDFNDWDRSANPMTCDEFGVWSLFLPDDDYAERLVHGSRVKVHVVSEDSKMDRIPAYIRCVARDDLNDYSGVFWDPEPFDWRSEPPKPPRSLRIYEAHVGMAQEEEKVGSYKEFTREVLPRIAKLGYNAVQLMAIQAHPYYASFGYQVSNFFAPSDHFGKPDELKKLIDRAHELGLLVFLDIIHSHTIKNTHEGLNEFDGTSYQYFHAGGRGEHWAWDSKLFDYSKFEVLRFLLSNVQYWMDEYHFDGFRFDGVTSMIYLDHGLHRDFVHYDDYFDEDNLDEDAILYLMLANKLVHEHKPGAVTIAEEVSGMPGLARPIEEGGFGFDYRLHMGVPDNWIKLLKEYRDEDWPLEDTFNLLANRRTGEKSIAYCESHDQALVGDKTIAFWLMDSHMYRDMAINHENHLIDRGIALHKLIRFMTFAFGGEGWLNFMGNEFGHPEWIDFPREGNGFDFKHARRQWSLVDNPFLRYQFLNNFDVAMQQLDDTTRLLSQDPVKLLFVHENHGVLVGQRGSLLFLFNFHPSQHYKDYLIGVTGKKNYRVILSSDEKDFGGFRTVTEGRVYPVQDVATHGFLQSIAADLPPRTAQVLGPVLV